MIELVRSLGLFLSSIFLGCYGFWWLFVEHDYFKAFVFFIASGSISDNLAIYYMKRALKNTEASINLLEKEILSLKDKIDR